MVALDLKSLVGRLNDLCRRQLEAAAGLTLSRGHYNVEIEHMLLKLAEAPGSDISAILRGSDVDAGRLGAELTRALDRMRGGNTRAPALSPDIVSWLREAWLIASIERNEAQLRSGHLLAALLSEDSLRRSVQDSAPSLMALSAEALRRDWPSLAAGSAEEGSSAALAPAPAADKPAAAPAGSGPLEQFCSDLTAAAQAGRIDPILGRDGEIRQVIDILTRRRQNNPILTGEPGVGKTAVAEGLALRIAAGEVPEALRTVRLLSLDLGLLQAGAGMKGEFENRLRGVIDAVKASPRPIVLFIDEAHTLIGAGGQQGQNDAANLLKPALARGELRCLAATTWAEYKKYFEKDAALTRRFQLVQVGEPSEALAASMLRGLVAVLETHHGVRILDEAVTEAVRLSARYIPARQLPDKGVSLLDTACARVAMSQGAIPAAIEDRRRRLELIGTETGVLQRESASGVDHAARRAALEAEREALQQELAALEARWAEEKALIAELAALRARAEAGEAEAATALSAASQKLRALQGEAPLVHPVVDGQAVAEVVATWTGIPVGRMLGDEIRTVLELKPKLEERVIGQPHALEAIAQAIRTQRAGLTDPRKPVGVFLMAGTSGVGKTETALALADLLYGGEQNLTVINMSEFKEEHKVSLLMGSPPGYVGYGEGGVLTEAVRRRPYSVILLDEMEKAHPGVQDVFYQVFDKGQMKDGEGRDIDFRNTVIIMTSNAGSDTIARLCADPEMAPEPAALNEALRPDLLQWFKPAFLGRCTLVTYYPLAPEILRRIVALNLRRIERRLRETYGVTLQIGEGVLDSIAARCTETDSGARNVETILTRTVLPELSSRILAVMMQGGRLSGVTLGVGADGNFDYHITSVAA
ncbi:type VI secretion system ATPase TssH [Pseudoroseomonas cervicalis]|uniref:type VI secretion system ATPase TssH n=1 Tax=Teichococcus cervicalis TaxID=204525 RepID=UPI0022F152D8|nr:type VI secretion system ATPase TssH [Pseudoroseomonas cervicalis]WBV44903.1 type VI secretion system ATPase TssH [Pseudoroseomonas cervicalis]